MSPERAGRLVAVVGPSGAGKDTLMAAAARHPGLPPAVTFARRIVTRTAVAATEDHDSLDEPSFLRAEAEGAFSLSWSAHGLHYALPRAVADDIARGGIVVANLSRRSLADAAGAFGAPDVVEVTARPEILIARLSARGRESEATIRARLARQAPVTLPLGIAGHLRIDNSGDLAEAVGAFVRHLDGLCRG